MTRTLSAAEAVVCGAGLAAAAVALELARRDLTVVLLSSGRVGRPAGPGAPVAAQAFVEEAVPDSRGRLALFARDLFPDWLSGLEEETGVPGEYDERGALTVASDEPEEVLLDRALDAQRKRGMPFEVLEPEEARGREPALAPELRAAFSFPRDGVARARRIGRALVLAGRGAGIRLIEGTDARVVARTGGRVSGVETSAGFIPATAVVLAERDSTERGEAGLPPFPLEAFARPWLRLDASSDPDRPGRLLVSSGVRLVPRRDGTLVARGRPGRDGRTGRCDASRLASLLEELRRLVPASTTWEAGESGAALELRAPDGLPLAGETDVAGLFLATAWGSDELLLAPAAARLVADLVTGQEPPVPAAPFAPARYGL
ncbi:MAG: NAD(P)/FAD-dependent oxidoreductase [Thermoanaerobaculia bacterium]